MSDLKRWHCTLCGELMTEQQTEDLTYQVFSGSREEPAEYAGRCANSRCNGTHDDQVEIWLCGLDGCETPVEDGTDHCTRHNLEADGFAVCMGCGSEPVPDEGELCAECYTTKLEAQSDAFHDSGRTL